MKHFMNPAEFANIARSERGFWWYRGMRTILFRVLDPALRGRNVDRVLEAGCGTGYLAHLLQTERRWPVVPLDISWEGLQHGRELGLDRAVQGNVLNLPFPAGTFDLVLSMDVLVHLPEGAEVDAMREMSRVLKPGGLLVVRAAALDVLRSRHSEFAHERQRYSHRKLMGLAASTGVRVLRCTYANSLLMPVALAKFRIWEPLLRKPPASGVEPVPRWLDKVLYAPLAAEAAWLGAGRSLPVGQSVILLGEKVL